MNKHQGFKAIRSLDYVILLCEDLEKVKNFYERLLEFQIEEDFPERMTFFRVGTLFLGLRKRGRAYDGPSVPSPSASIQISFRVPPADVDLAYDKLVENGLDVIERLCCTNPARDSSCESSMIAGGHEQLGPYKVQDHELVGLQ